MKRPEGRAPAQKNLKTAVQARIALHQFPSWEGLGVGSCPTAVQTANHAKYAKGNRRSESKSRSKITSKSETDGLEGGAEDARTPNAVAWSADSAASAKRLECAGRAQWRRRFGSGLATFAFGPAESKAACPDSESGFPPQSKTLARGPKMGESVPPRRRSRPRSDGLGFADDDEPEDDPVGSRTKVAASGAPPKASVVSRI